MIASILGACVALAAPATVVTGASHVDWVWDDTNQRLGVGTATPCCKLHIFSTATPVGVVERSTALTSNLTSVFALKHITSGNMADGFGSRFTFYVEDDTSGNQTIGSMACQRDGADNSGALVFETNNAGSFGERMRIDAGGYVGIGGIDPARPLSIKAPSGVSLTHITTTNDYISTTTGSVFVQEFGAASGNTYTLLGALNTGGSAWGDLVMQSGGGHVGIGTTTPKSALDVEGGVSIGATYSGTTAAPTNGAIIEGQVGIGTNAPSASAVVELSSTTGALLLPRLTTTERDALTAVAGMVIFNTTTTTFQGCTAAGAPPTWVDL